MRKTIALDALFPRTRQKLMAAILVQTNKAWYLSDLARHLELTPSSLQRELARLVEAGILTRRQDGNRAYYQADPHCPFLPELQRLMIKTAGLADVVRDALQPLAEHIDLALIYGSAACGAEGSRSDVDLLVVGRVGLARLVPALKQAEKRLQRAINPLTYSEGEFANRLSSGHHLLTSIFNGDVIYLWGDARELENRTRRRPRSSSHPEQNGV